jgi:hypothetical protein
MKLFSTVLYRPAMLMKIGLAVSFNALRLYAGSIYRSDIRAFGSIWTLGRAKTGTPPQAGNLLNYFFRLGQFIYFKFVPTRISAPKRRTSLDNPPVQRIAMPRGFHRATR